MSYGKEQVLKNVTLSIEKGKTTAIIGVNGSGKSTILKALGRLIKSDGQVIFDNQPLSQHSNREIARILALLPQSITAPADITVYELVSLGRFPHQKLMQQRLSKEDILFIEELMRETKIWDIRESKISELSGGQKQRLAIARAIAKKPEVFIFDDSFSALDFKTDAKLRKAINTELKESTLLIVAQRISTIMNANQIIVLDEGKVVGKGTHKELMKNCEVYQQIALSQLSKEELSNE